MTIDTQIARTQTEMELDDIASVLELSREANDDPDACASRMHEKADVLIRQHARAILSLMNIHDRIAKLVP